MPRSQNLPTQQRYREIQASLAEAGYYDGPQDGRWEKTTIEALSRFQEDYGLEPTGKIDALTLIKLGLGPKSEGNAQALNAADAASP